MPGSTRGASRIIVQISGLLIGFLIYFYGKDKTNASKNKHLHASFAVQVP